MERGYICIAHGGRGEDAADEVDVSSRGRRNQAGNNKALPEYRVERGSGSEEIRALKRRRVYYGVCTAQVFPFYVTSTVL